MTSLCSSRVRRVPLTPVWEKYSPAGTANIVNRPPEPSAYLVRDSVVMANLRQQAIRVFTQVFVQAKPGNTVKYFEDGIAPDDDDTEISVGDDDLPSTCSLRGGYLDLAPTMFADDTEALRAC